TISPASGFTLSLISVKGVPGVNSGASAFAERCWTWNSGQPLSRNRESLPGVGGRPLDAGKLHAPAGEVLVLHVHRISLAAIAPPSFSELAFQPQLVEVVLDLVLVLQEPVDGRLAAHGLADDLGGGLAVDAEQPDGVDVAQVVRLLFGKVAGA